MDKVRGGQSYEVQVPWEDAISSAFKMHSGEALLIGKKAALGV